MGTLNRNLPASLSSYFGYGDTSTTKQKRTTEIVFPPAVVDTSPKRDNSKTVPQPISSNSRKRSNSKKTCGECNTVLQPALEARSLRCGHFYCLDCLTKMEYGEVIRCPQCEEATVLDSTLGINELPKLDVPYGSMSPSPDLVHIGSPRSLSQSFVDVQLASGSSDSSGSSSDSQSDREGEESAGEVEFAAASPERGDDVEGRQDEDFVFLDSKSVPIAPKLYLPFTHNKILSKSLLEHWLHHTWMLPSDFEEKKKIMDFTAVYVPFYCFSVQTETSFKAEVGKVCMNSLGEEKLLWEEVGGEFTNNYEELLTCASYSVDRQLVEGLLKKQGSFSLNTNKKLPADAPLYTKTTKLAEKILATDVGLEEAFDLAGKDTIINKEEAQARSGVNENKGEQVKDFSCNTKITKMEYFLILLPIFLTGVEYQGKVYEVVISGNKGAVEGKRPYGSGLLGKMMTDSWKKVRSVYNDTV